MDLVYGNVKKPFYERKTQKSTTTNQKHLQETNYLPITNPLKDNIL